MKNSGNGSELTIAQIINDIKQAAKDAIPIGVVYFPMAVTFGLVAKQVGLGSTQTILFSAAVFAGAAQLVALELLAAGTGLGEILFATLLINLRHSLGGAALSPYLRPAKPWLLPFLAFGIVAPSTPLVISKGNRGERCEVYMLAVQFICYGFWVANTAVGVWLGANVPPSLEASVAFSFPALFIGLIVPMLRNRRMGIYIAVVFIAGVVSLALYIVLPVKSWSIIRATLIGATIGGALEWLTQQRHRSSS